ncbi:hypothetical protein [Sphingomonas montanisoli]|uniref:DUF1579 domain-containing protein n=1 Tax=Sphingomonas montanisoli TaxID=2606412 RepID=A0A5D9C3T3_9SPHN|nr:hypothetical protein [Sphingomonas montanisoli]TZG26339.1 hypothetical protein FYJ91_15500 [Sphingomonas montanisoli]
MRIWLALWAIAMGFMPTIAPAAEPGAAPIPAPVAALAGCWGGRGEVMGKSVSITVHAAPIVLDAMMAVDADSVATADPNDRYAAHLIFGGAGDPQKAPASVIMGYWTDSFGGTFAAAGNGEVRADGFDMTYAYPDDAFVNRWRMKGDALSWQIVARDANGVEKPFASYALQKAACASSAKP